MNPTLEKKVSSTPVALVTGGRRGLGAAIARALCASGFDIAIADLEHDGDADETLNAIRAAGRRAAFFEANIADLGRHDALLDEVQASLGSVDCLVNNAGVSVEKRGDLLDVTPESFDRLLNINLRGTFFLTQRLARRFAADADAEGRARSIINISSANAFLIAPNRAEYCISKSALTTVTKLFAARLGELGVPVYEVRPGIFQTRMTEVAQADYDEKLRQGFSPIPRWGTVDEIGKAVASLASGCFPFSTGDSFHIDGGLHIHRV